MLQPFADRLEEGLAVLLDQRLEESHAEHLAFALVDAGGEIVVDVVAEEMALEERTAAVGLHEQFDGGLLHRLAAEDLGDDAFEFAAIAFVDEPGTPGDHGVGPGDEGGEPGDSPFDQLASLDRLAVGTAEMRPRQHVGEHHSHASRRPGAERHAAEVEAVIGNGQAVAALGDK